MIIDYSDLSCKQAARYVYTKIADNGMRAKEIMRYADCFISTRKFSSLIYGDYAKKTVSALNTRIFNNL